MIETAKIIQAICYILTQIQQTDKLKIVKLLFLADKYHLIRYGRSVTHDEYWAMDYGPVGSAAKDILGCDREFLSGPEAEYASRMIRRVDEHAFEQEAQCLPADLTWLSETDLEALDFVIKAFGRWSTHQLIDLTHRYPEWSQYKELFEKKMTRRERIEDREMLSLLDKDPLAVPKEHLEESLRIVTGVSG